MTPQQIIFLSIVGIALVALIFLSESQKRYNLDSIKRKTVGDGQYGTARWATQEEIQSSTIQVPYEPEAWRYNKESRPTTAGIVVNLKQNKKQILATIDPSDSHTLMVAGTGGGKTTTFMIPNIEYALACGTSFISTDSKGDLLRLYGKLCEQYGYTCLNINFRTPMKSDSYNYMQLINLYIDMWRDDPKRVDYHSRAERYAKALANSIVHTKGFDGGGQNSYFYDSSEGLITSIILLVAQYCKPEERHMLFFYQMHKLVLERKRQRTAALKRRYAYSLFAAPLSSMHLLFPIPRCFISKERKNKSLPLAKSNSLMGLLRRKAMDRARSPMVEFSG